LSCTALHGDADRATLTADIAESGIEKYVTFPFLTGGQLCQVATLMADEEPITKEDIFGDSSEEEKPDAKAEPSVTKEDLFGESDSDKDAKEAEGDKVVKQTSQEDLFGSDSDGGVGGKQTQAADLFGSESEDDDEVRRGDVCSSSPPFYDLMLTLMWMIAFPGLL